MDAKQLLLELKRKTETGESYNFHIEGQGLVKRILVKNERGEWEEIINFPVLIKEMMKRKGFDNLCYW